MSRYRRSITPGATYFFTLALADRQSQLLTQNIERLRTVYQHTQKQHPFKTIAICILPDHLHAVWEMPANDADFSLRWRLIKSHFSRSIPAAQRSDSKARKKEKGIWQRRFWEHQIRDDEDLQKHVDYIHINPVKHGCVNHVRDWPYSSYHQWVKKGLLDDDWAGSFNEGFFGELND